MTIVAVAGIIVGVVAGIIAHDFRNWCRKRQVCMREGHAWFPDEWEGEGFICARCMMQSEGDN
jgi:hypothetical protein